MRKNWLAGSLTLSMFLAMPTWAHHGEDHHEPPVLPPIGGDHHEDHVPPVIQAPPIVQVPPPVVTPSPVVQVVTPPTITFQLPLMAPPSTILPTDIAGMHSGPDASKFQQLPSSAPLTKEALAAIIAPDFRYQFTGQWILFSSNYVASLPVNELYKSVAYLREADGQTKQYGKVEHIEKHQAKSTEPAFMPTMEASYSKVNDEHLALHSGAILVRAGDRPVFVSSEVKSKKVLTRVSGGALAVISAIDGKATVLSLTDKCCGALVLYVPSAELNKQHSIAMKPGQIAEVYAPDDKPISNLVATKIDLNQRIGHDYGLLVSQCHYIRALRKFGLVQVLAKNDMDRVLKTAAAIAYVRR